MQIASVIRPPSISMSALIESLQLYNSWEEKFTTQVDTKPVREGQ